MINLFYVEIVFMLWAIVYVLTETARAAVPAKPPRHAR